MSNQKSISPIKLFSPYQGGLQPSSPTKSFITNDDYQNERKISPRQSLFQKQHGTTMLTKQNSMQEGCLDKDDRCRKEGPHFSFLLTPLLGASATDA